jgi:MATE family multidrug resistance protein
MIDGIMLGATKTKVLRNSVAISFIVYLILLYTLMPIIRNNAIWTAFLTFILLRGILLIKPLIKLTKGDGNNRQLL